jgi:hypothetical protein
MEIISRANAKRAGLNLYFTGAPCVHGHISERFVRNHTCVECSDIRGHKANSLSLPLPQCRVCENQVRAHGHATCSPECGATYHHANRLAKNRIKYRLKAHRSCRHCGGIIRIKYKQFCSAGCHVRHLSKPQRDPVPCLVCGRLITAAPNQKLCSSNCRQQRRVQSGYVAEYGRSIRSRVAATVTIARDLEILAPRGHKSRHDGKPKRRREREQYAVMIAFRRMGLLPTTGEIKT